MILIFPLIGYLSNLNKMTHSIWLLDVNKTSTLHLEIWVQTNHLVIIVIIITYKVYSLIIHTFLPKGYKTLNAIIALLYMGGRIISLVNFSLVSTAANMCLQFLRL
jgi:hypothetical protein